MGAALGNILIGKGDTAAVRKMGRFAAGADRIP
jgi:hypothetical protein